MASASGAVAGVGKLWIYPTLGLVLVGAPVLAASWSDTFANGVGTTGGIVVSDGPDLVKSFQDNLDATATTGSGSESESESERPTVCLNGGGVVVAKAADGTCPVGSTPKGV